MNMMRRDGELSAAGRLVWLAAAMLLGLASQWCVNYGSCAAMLG